MNKSAENLAAQSAKLSSALSEASARDVGSAAWKSLWQAAHAYVADTDGTFPPAPEATEALCPLCHQELSAEAASRMRRFEEFFRGEVEKQTRDVARKRDAIGSALAKLPSIEEQISTQAPLIFGGEAVLEGSVAALVKSAALRRGGIQGHSSALEIPASPLAPDPVPSIQQWVIALRQKAAEQKALAAPDAITKAKREVAELENRLLLGERLPAVLGRIETLKHVAKLRRA